MRIMVGISGGVDSAVAALLLQRQGHDVRGLFMKNWEDDDHDGCCSAEADYRSARAVCETLEIPLYFANFSDDYRKRVFGRFLAAYRAGLTPNPDVLCNKEIKFRSFIERASALGAERVATGHYARLTTSSQTGLLELRKARDPHKDQSYFLCALAQHQLAWALFPLGDLHKGDVRRIARESGLPNHDRKDSTGICFIGERHFRSFLERYLPKEPGAIHDLDGAVVGQHDGLMYYTVGQRRGLGIGGPGKPWYVVDKRPSDNVLIVTQGNHPARYSSDLIADGLEWVAGSPPALPLRAQAKVRYRQEDQDCLIDADDEQSVRVSFDVPQSAVAPGQSVAFYADDVCLGGGIIVHPGVRDQRRHPLPELR